MLCTYLTLALLKKKEKKNSLKNIEPYEVFNLNSTTIE